MLLLNLHFFDCVKALVRLFLAFVDTSVTSFANFFQKVIFFKKRVLVNKPFGFDGLNVTLRAESCAIFVDVGTF